MGRGIHPGGVIWCVLRTISYSGRWGSTWNYQGVLCGLFTGQDTAEFEEVAVYQCGVSRKEATLHAWVAFMINTSDGEKRDNSLDGDSLYTL